MIKPECDMCGKELNVYGAILLSPPDCGGKYDKYHICEDCYGEVVRILMKPENYKYVGGEPNER